MGLGYRQPEGRFGGELLMTHHQRKELGRTTGACSGECYRPDAFTILDLTAFVRVTDAFTLRAGIFNLTDAKYTYWSDVRGLSATSSVTDAYTRVRGHGLGLYVDTKPQILEDVHIPLEAGMTIIVHPNTYHPVVGYMVHGDALIVREDGAEVLTRTPRRLFSVPA